jgi:hypothetical protein
MSSSGQSYTNMQGRPPRRSSYGPSGSLCSPQRQANYALKYCGSVKGHFGTAPLGPVPVRMRSDPPTLSRAIEVCLVTVLCFSAFRNIALGSIRIMAVPIAILILRVVLDIRHLMFAILRYWPLILILGLQTLGACLSYLAGRGSGAFDRLGLNLVMFLAFAVPVSLVAMRSREGTSVLRQAGWIGVSGIVIFVAAPQGWNPASTFRVVSDAIASVDPGRLNTELFIAPVEWWGSMIGSEIIRGAGSFRHQLLEGLLLASLVALHRSDGQGRSSRAATAFYVAVALTFLALSRALMLGLSLSLAGVLLCPVAENTPRFRRRTSVLMVVVVVAVGQIIMARIEGGDTRSYEVRGGALVAYVDSWIRHPLVGDVRTYEEVGVTAHNLVLDWSVIYGLCGLAASIVLVLVVGLRGGRALRQMLKFGTTVQSFAIWTLSTIVLARVFTTGGATLSPAMWMAASFVILVGEASPGGRPGTGLLGNCGRAHDPGGQLRGDENGGAAIGTLPGKGACRPRGTANRRDCGP